MLSSDAARLLTPTFMASSREAGAAAELAASHKVTVYAGLILQGEFVPIAIEMAQ